MLYNDKKQCAIVDPGCYFEEEEEILQAFIEENELEPMLLLNTHCHLDHIYGNRLVADTFNLKPMFHKMELFVVERAESTAHLYGLPAPEPSPLPDRFLDENDVITLGDVRLRILFTPGHSPGSICFYNEAEGWVIAGDVLFRESIGRTDIPGGNHDTLLQSIASRLLTLPNETRILPGHGEETTIGHERQFNPFF